MSKPAPLAVEDHCEAYFAWKRARIRGAWCWHVDAHLDIGRDGLDAARLGALAPCQTSLEAGTRKLSGNAYLPWGGLHCGNYLYPAIREGIVSRLTWVIPPDLVEGRLLSWARAHLDGWVDLTLEEYAGLEEMDGRVEGTLLGIPFALGTFEKLPRPEEPVLLDIDIDYFLTTEGERWQEPEVLQEQLGPIQSVFTTLAYSVKGGYTPTAYRKLARPFVDGTVEGYSAQPIDEAAALVRFHRYREALTGLKALQSSHPIISGYLAGICHHHLKQYQEALDSWAPLLERKELSPDGRAYLGGLCSEMLSLLDRPGEALAYAKGALNEVGPDYRLFWAAALALEKSDDLRGATKMVRRGLRLAEPYLFGLQMRLVLARLYRKQNKQGLASLELERLERADVTGRLRPLTLLR